MRKLRIITAIFILAFSFYAKAEVLLTIDCSSNKITSSDKVTCEGTLIYEMEDVTDISFDYATNLNIEFKSIPDFKLSKNNNHISIHTDTPLNDPDMGITQIMEFTLGSKDDLKDKEDLIFKNIKANESINVESYSDQFNVVLETKLDDTCTLDTIIIDNKKLDNFDKNTLEYNINTASREVFIDADRSSSKSSVTGLGKYGVPNGTTKTFEIVVTSESGNKKTYKVNITNTSPVATPVENNIEVPKEKSKDNTLKILTLFHENERVDFEYDSSKSSFNIEVEDPIDKISIVASTMDSTAMFVSGYAPRDVTLKYGNNKVLIKVKAENGDIKTYTLNIKRKDGRSKDNSLLSLIINGQEINLGDKSSYEITVPHETVKSEISAITNNNKAKIEYKDITLADGDNDLTINVTAENGEKKEYNVNVIREEEVDIENIKVNGYNLNFSKDIKEYSLKVSDNTKKLDIEVLPKNIKYEILGNEELHHNSQITINVELESEKLTYNINIIKEDTKKDNNQDSSVLKYVAISMGLISIIASILYYIKKKKTS